MKTLKYQIAAILFFSLTFVSCEKEILESDNFNSTSNIGNTTNNVARLQTLSVNYYGSDTLVLWAGQTINAGTLIVSNDANNLYVTYNTTGVFGTLHLWVGTDMTLLPKNSQGTPINGQFPHVVDASGYNSYTFTIPLSSISFFTQLGDIIYVVAHAEVTINGKNETAYGGNITGTGTNRWYYYAAYQTKSSDVQPPAPVEKLGTAFAKGGYVFTTDKKSNPENLPSLNLTKNRWGWAVNIKSAGTSTYGLYVGAGLNNISKGKLVGSVSISYTGAQATVTYNLNSGFVIEEAHIYADDFRPTTLAPGQYGNTFYFNPFAATYSLTVDISDTNGDGIWFIVHAVAFGPGVKNVN